MGQKARALQYTRLKWLPSDKQSSLFGAFARYVKMKCCGLVSEKDGLLVKFEVDAKIYKEQMTRN